MKHYSHGEVNIFQITALPKGLNKIKSKYNRYIVADSETTGNYHIVEDQEGIEMYEKDGILYMVNSEPAKVKCVHDGRHDMIELEPSVWEIDKAREYDHLTKQVQMVAD